MTEAVIVSTARTPIGKAYRGALNATEGATLLGHAVGEAVARAKVDPKEVEDVVMGVAMQQGATGGNIARKALLRAGLPVTVGGTTIDRQCGSGLQAIALAARAVIFDGVEIAVGGGGESISLVQNDHANKFHTQDPALLEIKGDHAVLLPAVSVPRQELPEELRKKFLARRGAKSTDIPLDEFFEEVDREREKRKHQAVQMQASSGNSHKKGQRPAAALKSEPAAAKA